MTRRESGMERRLVSLLTREGKEKRRRGCGEWNGWTETSCCAESNVSWFKKKKKEGIETGPLIYDRKERRHRARFRARREKREQNRVVAARCISYARAHWSWLSYKIIYCRLHREMLNISRVQKALHESPLSLLFLRRFFSPFPSLFLALRFRQKQNRVRSWFLRRLVFLIVDSGEWITCFTWKQLS